MLNEVKVNASVVLKSQACSEEKLRVASTNKSYREMSISVAAVSASEAIPTDSRNNGREMASLMKWNLSGVSSLTAKFICMNVPRASNIATPSVLAACISVL